MRRAKRRYRGRRMGGIFSKIFRMAITTGKKVGEKVLKKAEQHLTKGNVTSDEKSPESGGGQGD